MTTVKEFLKPSKALPIGDICQTGKARVAHVFDEKGKPVRVVFAKDCSLRTPWQVSSFDGSTRCSLDIIMNEELEAFVNKIDASVLKWVQDDPTRYFKSPPNDISAWFKSLKKEASKEGYSSTMRTK